MSAYFMNEIKSEKELSDVLNFCYQILGERNDNLYGYEAWYKRLKDRASPMVYGVKDNIIISAVMGRPENQDSLIIGFAACHEKYRRQGYTKKLLCYFEKLAEEKGYKYITLGSENDGFYEKCGYSLISKIHGQNIYQKLLF